VSATDAQGVVRTLGSPSEGNKMRVKQPTEARGSLRWVRELLYHRPGMLDDALRATIPLSAGASTKWVSPRADDEHAEYRDNAALKQLGASRLLRPLSAFWPLGGPQWDALGRFGADGMILVEAKANLGELISPASQASPESLRRIRAACDEAKSFYGAPPSVSWVGPYYQYANRLAHLYFLREVNQLNAHLVFLYFLNDPDTQGPASAQLWRPAIDEAHATLGLRAPLPRFVHEVFVDVRRLG
jgi:hypothetical protein